MKNKMFTTMLVAVFTTFILADAASAYYSPRMGRFLNRDPIGETGALVVKAANATNPFMPRDPIGTDDANNYAAIRNNPLSWIDPDGGEAQSSSSSQRQNANPGGSDCGIRVKRSPLCIEHGYLFPSRNLGHTWIDLGDGVTVDYPPNYIEDGNHACQKGFVHKEWKTVTTNNGLTCSEIRSCLQDMEDKWRTRWFFLLVNDCRQFARAALAECGLKRVEPPLVNRDVVKRYCCDPCSRTPTGASKYKGGQ